MANINIIGFEVVQSIQNFHNEIPLIQGKPTYIRVYLYASWRKTQIENIEMDGTLLVKVENSKLRTRLNSLATVSQPKLHAQPKLIDQRLDWNQSLNFKLPDNFFDDHVNKDRVATVSLSKITVNGSSTGHTTQENKSDFLFKKKVELYCRAVAYRYLDRRNQVINTPSPGQLDVIRSFIEKAFPISKLHWSTVTIDAPRRFNRLRKIAQRSERSEEKTDLVYSLLFQNLLAIRNQDISRGKFALSTSQGSTEIKELKGNTWHPNTLYLGVIDDPSGRFGGAAMDSPQFPTPHMVAFAVAESDGALGAHELAHLLGRLHPGIPDKKIHGKYIGQTNQYLRANCTSKDSSPPTGPNRSEVQDYGYISIHTDADTDTQAKKIFLGLDCRNDERSPSILAYNEYFDLMTYQYPQWVSDHTYKGLHETISSISAQSSPKTYKYWTIIGEYNLQTKTAHFSYVLPSVVDTNPPASKVESSPRLKLDYEWYNSKKAKVLLPDELPKSVPDSATIHIRSSTTDANAYIGVFQHTVKVLISHNLEPEKIVLKLDNIEVDIYSFSNNENSISQWKESNSSLMTQDSRPQSTADIGFTYSVDDGAYYLDFNLHPALEYLSTLGVAITTTVQFKREWNSDVNSKKSELGIGDWETVTVTNRLKEKIWVNPIFIAHLKPYRPTKDSELELYDIEDKENIFSTEDTFQAIKLNCRLIVNAGDIVMGEMKIEDGTIISLEPYFNFSIQRNIDCPTQNDSNHHPEAQTYGSTGSKGENYFAPAFTDDDPTTREHSSASTHQSNRQYYRPSVNPKNLPCKKGKKSPCP